MTKHLYILHNDAQLHYSLVDLLVKAGYRLSGNHHNSATIDSPIDLVIFNIEDHIPLHEITNILNKLDIYIDGQQILYLVSEKKMTEWQDRNPATFLIRPFRFAELLEKIEALTSAMSIGLYRFYASGRELIGPNDQRLPLTEKEVSILVYLLQSKEQTATREDLLKLVWGYASDSETHTIETHIYRLRQKLAQFTGETEILATIDGGYRLQY